MFYSNHMFKNRPFCPCGMGKTDGRSDRQTDGWIAALLNATYTLISRGNNNSSLIKR